MATQRLVLSGFLPQGECLHWRRGVRRQPAPGSGSWPRSRTWAWRVALQRGPERSLHSLHGKRSSCRAFLLRWRSLSKNCEGCCWISRCSGTVCWLQGWVFICVVSNSSRGWLIYFQRNKSLFLVLIDWIICFNLLGPCPFVGRYVNGHISRYSSISSCQSESRRFLRSFCSNKSFTQECALF